MFFHSFSSHDIEIAKEERKKFNKLFDFELGIVSACVSPRKGYAEPVQGLKANVSSETGVYLYFEWFNFMLNPIWEYANIFALLYTLLANFLFCFPQ